MAFYLVEATADEDRLGALRGWLDSGEISRMEPFGETLQHALENARLREDGKIVWEEEDYCRPPLAQEKEAVLNEYFTDISVEAVERGDGWKRINDLPLLWDEVDS